MGSLLVRAIGTHTLEVHSLACDLSQHQCAGAVNEDIAHEEPQPVSNEAPASRPGAAHASLKRAQDVLRKRTAAQASQHATAREQPVDDIACMGGFL
jgi:hypothetical protein